MRHDPDEELLDRLEAARETLREEHGAEWDYWHGEYTKELAPYVLKIGFALLKANERIAAHLKKHGRQK